MDISEDLKALENARMKIRQEMIDGADWWKAFMNKKIEPVDIVQERALDDPLAEEAWKLIYTHKKSKELARFVTKHYTIPYLKGEKGMSENLCRVCRSNFMTIEEGMEYDNVILAFWVLHLADPYADAIREAFLATAESLFRTLDVISSARRTEKTLNAALNAVKGTGREQAMVESVLAEGHGLMAYSPEKGFFASIDDIKEQAQEDRADVLFCLRKARAFCMAVQRYTRKEACCSTPADDLLGETVKKDYAAARGLKKYSSTVMKRKTATDEEKEVALFPLYKDVAPTEDEIEYMDTLLREHWDEVFGKADREQAGTRAAL